MTSVARADSRELNARLAGAVFTPADDGWDAARTAWNVAIDQRPAAVAYPVDEDDVAGVLAYARDNGLRVAPQGTGHNAGPLGSLDKTILLRTAAMRGVEVDPQRRIARVRAGDLWQDAMAPMAAHGMTALAGSSPDVGIVGYSLGGGMGWLARKHGLQCNSIRAVELVTADGRTVRASESEEPELFWGIRGAGANFGVVTAFEFDLHPFGPLLHRGVRIYPASEVHAAWSMFRSFADVAPDELGLIFSIARAEPAADYPASLAGGPIVVVSYNHSGDAADVERDVAPLKAGPGPASRTDVSRPYLEAQTANDLAMGWGHRSYITGGYADDFRPESLDALVEHVARGPEESAFAMTVQGGAIGRVPDDA
ncbi:MAG: FAD-binding oxidoreductase, partial [Solirubrobacteraceae bacterium]